MNKTDTSKGTQSLVDRGREKSGDIKDEQLQKRSNCYDKENSGNGEHLTGGRTMQKSKHSG